jgi:hypothetical protein
MQLLCHNVNVVYYAITMPIFTNGIFYRPAKVTDRQKLPSSG